MLSREKILSEIYSFSNEYPEIRFGLAGSYARDEQTEDSDIDIILDAKDIVVGNLGVNTNIFTHFEKVFYPTKIDLVWLPLLEEGKLLSDEFRTEQGLPINNSSPYDNIMKEVMWCEE